MTKLNVYCCVLSFFLSRVSSGSEPTLEWTKVKRLGDACNVSVTCRYSIHVVDFVFVNHFVKRFRLYVWVVKIS